MYHPKIFQSKKYLIGDRDCFTECVETITTEKQIFKQ